MAARCWPYLSARPPATSLLGWRVTALRRRYRPTGRWRGLGRAWRRWSWSALWWRWWHPCNAVWTSQWSRLQQEQLRGQWQLISTSQGRRVASGPCDGRGSPRSSAVTEHIAALPPVPLRFPGVTPFSGLHHSACGCSWVVGPPPVYPSTGWRGGARPPSYSGSLPTVRRPWQRAALCAVVWPTAAPRLGGTAWAVREGAGGPW